jgi:hypothetical protein
MLRISGNHRSIAYLPDSYPAPWDREANAKGRGRQALEEWEAWHAGKQVMAFVYRLGMCVGTPLGVVRMRHNTPLDNSRFKEYIYACDDTTTADRNQPDVAVRDPPAHGRGAHVRPRGRPEARGTLAEPI